MNHHTFQVSDSCNSKAQKDCCFQMVLVLSCKTARCQCKWRLKAGLSSLGCGDDPIQFMEQGVISRPSILLTATDSELLLASTSSLFLESSSASPSSEVGPTKTGQQSCLLCSAQEDEVSGQPWALQRAESGTATCSNG